VNITISLQGRGWTGAPKDRNIRTEIYNASGTVDKILNGTSNATTGIVSYAVSIPAGTYSILVKPEGYLQMKLVVNGSTNIALTGGTNNIVASSTFKGGDFAGTQCKVGDGKINSLDLNCMLALWKPNYDVFYDLTGDGEINSLDLVIMISNWNQLDEVK